MLKLELQFFGGRGSSSDGGGKSLPDRSKKGLSRRSIAKEVDVWSYRHRKDNEAFVDAINTSVRQMSDDFPSLMQDVNVVSASTLKGAAASNVLGYYGDGTVGINRNYTNIDKMNATYDAAVKSGFHPSRGNKSGTEAVTYHEMGHALTDSIKSKLGVGNLDAASKKIVNDAYKSVNGKKGTAAFASNISRYATESYAECVAEAVADFYCNGSKATKESKAIMKELKKYS